MRQWPCLSESINAIKIKLIRVNYFSQSSSAGAGAHTGKSSSIDNAVIIIIIVVVLCALLWPGVLLTYEVRPDGEEEWSIN